MRIVIEDIEVIMINELSKSQMVKIGAKIKNVEFTGSADGSMEATKKEIQKRRFL